MPLATPNPWWEEPMTGNPFVLPPFYVREDRYGSSFETPEVKSNNGFFGFNSATPGMLRDVLTGEGKPQIDPFGLYIPDNSWQQTTQKSLYQTQEEKETERLILEEELKEAQGVGSTQASRGQTKLGGSMQPPIFIEGIGPVPAIIASIILSRGNLNPLNSRATPTDILKNVGEVATDPYGTVKQTATTLASGAGFKIPPGAFGGTTGTTTGTGTGSGTITEPSTDGDDISIIGYPKSDIPETPTPTTIVAPVTPPPPPIPLGIPETNTPTTPVVPTTTPTTPPPPPGKTRGMDETPTPTTIVAPGTTPTTPTTPNPFIPIVPIITSNSNMPTFFPPTDRNYLEEGRLGNTAYNELGKNIYGNYEKYAPMYGQRDLKSLQALYGNTNANTLGEINKSAYGAMEGTLSGDLQNMAQEQLALGSSLSAQQIRDSQQASRAAGQARGLLMGPNSVGNEVLNQDRYGQQLLQQRQAFAGSVNPQLMQNASQINQLGTDFISGRNSNPFVQDQINPFNQYANDVYGSNFNAGYAGYLDQIDNATAEKIGRQRNNANYLDIFARGLFGYAKENKWFPSSSDKK